MEIKPRTLNFVFRYVPEEIKFKTWQYPSSGEWKNSLLAFHGIDNIIVTFISVFENLSRNDIKFTIQRYYFNTSPKYFVY